MRTRSAKRDDRIELPASREQKRILAAAACERLDLTNFAIRTALPAALRAAARRHVALAIDAKDEPAATWYERFGALRLLDDPLKLVPPLDTIRAAV